MSVENHPTETRNTIKSIRAQYSEDPHREPHEKETALHVLDDDKQERTVDCLQEAAAATSLTIIGVTGRIPVGAVKQPGTATATPAS